MTCRRCSQEVCWCCMTHWNNHRNGRISEIYFLYPCPFLSYNSRILVTLLVLSVMIFAPIVFVLGAIIAALVGSFHFPTKYFKTHKQKGCIRILGLILAILLLIPVLLTLAALVSAIVVPLGTIYVWYCGLNFMTRSTINYLRTQL